MKHAITKKGLLLLLALVMVMALASCGSTDAGKDAEAVDYSVVTADAATKTVKMYAEVNGKYFTENTRHGIVYAEGGNGEKSVLRGLANEKDFYQALINIGAVPGDNLTLPMEPGLAVDGAKLDITVSWDGSDGEIPFGEIIRTGDGDPYVMDARFGGNIKAAYAKNTGCIFCLDSCAVGITSNAAYPTGTIEGTKTEQFFGNADVLPKDGTVVTVTFTVLD